MLFYNKEKRNKDFAIVMLIALIVNTLLYHFGKNQEIAEYILPIAPLLCIQAYVDLKTRELPDIITYILFIFSLTYCFINSDNAQYSLIVALVILIVGAILSFGLNRIGFGDIKIITALCLLLGYIPLVTILLYASIFAVIFLIGRNIISKTNDKEIAFGPFIYLGLVLYICII